MLATLAVAVVLCCGVGATQAGAQCCGDPMVDVEDHPGDSQPSGGDGSMANGDVMVFGIIAAGWVLVLVVPRVRYAARRLRR
jgi:hypothetical protein